MKPFITCGAGTFGLLIDGEKKIIITIDGNKEAVPILQELLKELEKEKDARKQWDIYEKMCEVGNPFTFPLPGDDRSGDGEEVPII